jgi:hypothetical protein
MPGMIARPTPSPSAPPQATPPVATKGTMNPVLMKVRQRVESKLPPQLQDGVQRIVVAGMKILYDRSTQSAVQKIYDAIAKGGFQPQAIATGMVNLLGMIAQGSKGKMPVHAAYPAGVILLTYVLDDLAQTRGLTITDQLVKDIGKHMAQLFVKAFGINQGAPTPAPAPTPNPAPAPAGV